MNVALGRLIRNGLKATGVIEILKQITRLQKKRVAFSTRIVF